MSIIPNQPSLSDEENLDENEPDLFSTNIRKHLMDDFNSETPVKVARQSVPPRREHMKVFLRIRPFTGDEVEAGEAQDCMEVTKDTTLTMKAPKNSFAFKSSMRGCQDMTHNFTFTSIHGSEAGQKAFFDDTMLSSVKNVIDGQNCLVFTYGVTNAGKSYTIQGVPEDGGILPRSLDVIFNSIDGRHFDSMRLKPKYFCDVVRLTDSQVENQAAAKAAILCMAGTPSQGIEPDSLEASDLEISKRISSNSTIYEDSLMSDSSSSSFQGTRESSKESDITQSILNDIKSRIPDDTSIDVEAQGPVMFSIWVSFAEIYNEYIYDLLEPMPKSKKERRQVLKLCEDKNGSIFVKGLKEIQVSNADEAYRVLKIGQKNLSIAATKLNHNSSRSHCIFSIKILRVVDVADPHVARISKISFCDLAGSERSTKTHSVGDRLKEAGNINTSLLTLGKCIHALRYNQNHSSAHTRVIPFRESKLTRLFQSFFQGKGVASMIVNVNQCASMFDETMHVLKFSAIAKQVTTVISKLDNKLQLPKPKNKLISARALSLAVGKSMKSNSRPSVPWATPRTMAQEVRLASDLTKIDESILDEDEEEDDDDLDDTMFEEDDSTPVGKAGVEGTSRAVLLNLVNVLKNELVGAKQQLRTMETQIRAEVCEEMSKQLVEIEASYNERLQEEKEMAEEVYEKKMEILTKSVKKTHSKRPRTQQEDTEEYVPAMVHTALQAKMEEKDEEIAKLDADLKRTRAELTELRGKMETEDQQLTELRDATSDENEKNKEKIELLERQTEELRTSKSEGEVELAATKNCVENLSQQLEKWKTDAATERNQLQKDFQAQLEDVLSKNKQQLAEMREGASSDLMNYRSQLDEVLSEKDKLVAAHQGVVKELEGLKEAAGNDCQNYQSQVAEALSEKEKLVAAHQGIVKELEVLKEAARNDCQLEELLTEKETLAADKKKLAQELTEQRELSRNELQESNAQLERALFEKDELAAISQELGQKIAEMKESTSSQQQDSKAQLEEALSEKKELTVSFEKLEQKLAEMKGSTDSHQQESKAQLERVLGEKDELAAISQELEQKIAKMKESTNSQQQGSEAQLEKALFEKKELTVSLEKLEQKLAEMKESTDSHQQESKAQLERALFEKDEQVSISQELEQKIAEMKESTSSQQQGSDAQLEKALFEKKELTVSLEKLEQKLAEMKESTDSHQQESKAQLERALFEKDEQASISQELEQKIAEMKESTSSQQQDSRTQSEEVLSEKKELAVSLKKLEQKLAEMKESTDSHQQESKAQLERALFEKDELAAIHQQLEQKIAEMKESTNSQQQDSEDQLEKALSEKEELTVSFEKLEQKLAEMKGSTDSHQQDSNAKLEKAVIEKEELAARHQELEQEIAQMKVSTNSKQQALEGKFQEAISERNVLVSSLEVLEQQMKTMKDEHLIEKKGTEFRLEAAKSALVKAKLDEQSRQDTAINDSGELQSRDAEIANLRSEIEKLTEERSRMQKDLEQAKMDSEKCLQDTTEQFGGKITQLQTKLEETQDRASKSSAVEDELSVYKTRLDSAVVENEKTLADKTDLENTVKKLNKQIEQGKEECQRIMAENKELSKAMEVLERKTVDLTTQAIELTKSRAQEYKEEAIAANAMADLEAGLENGSKDREDDGSRDQEDHGETSRISFAEQASTDTSRVEVDATPLMKRKKLVKTRKRKSTDPLQEDETDRTTSKERKGTGKEEVAPRRQTRGARSRRAKTTLGFEERENIPEEEHESPDAVSITSTDSTTKKGALSKIGGAIRNSPLGQSAKKFMTSTTTSSAHKSPATVTEVHPEVKPKKRKLFKTDISAPLECSPFETITIGDAKVMESRQRASRRLRSRNKKNTLG